MKINLQDFDKNEMLDDTSGTIIDNAEMGEENRVMGSSPPCSPPNVLSSQYH